MSPQINSNNKQQKRQDMNMTNLTRSTAIYLFIGIALFVATLVIAAPFNKNVVNRAADVPSAQVVSLQ